MVPPAWSLRYQQLGRYGIIILIVLLWTDVGRPLFNIWMKPVITLTQASLQLVLPFFLKSPYAMGIG